MDRFLSEVSAHAVVDLAKTLLAPLARGLRRIHRRRDQRDDDELDRIADEIATGMIKDALRRKRQEDR
jgi:hypothetical protein